MKTQFSNPIKFLDYLNTTFSKLHTTYEDLFWFSYMGDHGVDKRMNIAQKKRDNFRSDSSLKKQVEAHIPLAKGIVKERLQIWSHFFGLYQVPQESKKYKEKAQALESEVLKKRAKRKEGYIDPKTRKFVEASENKMRIIMRTNPDERIRRACFEGLEKLALFSINDYIKLVRYRNAFACSLGYSDFYAYKLDIDEGMTKKELFGMFEGIYKKTKHGFKGLKKLEKQKPGLRKPWNFGYMLTGNFTKEEDPYFQFENVLSYWGESFAALGVDFQKGSLTLDLLDRKGKYSNGFCHYPGLVRFIMDERIPGRCNFTSNAVPGQMGAGAQAIQTVFHEAGHAADRLNSEMQDTCVNTEYPPSTISWSETQSMFMDSISSSAEWRMRYAKDIRGNFYPFELYERKLKALYPTIILNFMHYLFVTVFEKKIYEAKNLDRKGVISIAKGVYKKYNGRSENSLSVLNVPHIYSWESSAYYHGYALADLGVVQWRKYFYDKYGYIVDNPNVGKEMRNVWKYGSLYSARKFIKIATGKKLNSKAYLDAINLPLPKMLEKTKRRIAHLKKIPHKKGSINLNAKIQIVHGKRKIADNGKSFEDMDRKFKAWIRTQK